MAASAAARRVNQPTARVARPMPAQRPQGPNRGRSGRPTPRRGSNTQRSRPRASVSRRRGITPTAGLMIPVAVGQRTATAVGGIADSGLVLRLTRGRLWILLVGILLVGIVALNVLTLSFSASASRAAVQADALQRQSSALRAEQAIALSGGEVEARAAELGLSVPQPGAIRYLEPLSTDDVVAANRLRDGLLTAP